jgi:hypothetical protein
MVCARNLRAYYAPRGWGIPAPDAQAHHIKPLAFGGGNNYMTNGVFLTIPDHQMFTSWWDAFSTRAWQAARVPISVEHERFRRRR